MAHHAGDGGRARPRRGRRAARQACRVAGAMSSGGVTIGHYIIEEMALFLVPPARYRPARGLDERRQTRRAPAADRRRRRDARRAARGEDRVERHGGASPSRATPRPCGCNRGAKKAGVLVEVRVTPLDRAAVRDRVVRRRRDAQRRRTARGRRTRAARRACCATLQRVLRPGGRLITIEPGTATGPAVDVPRRRPRPRPPTRRAGGTLAALRQAGFGAVRDLGDREGSEVRRRVCGRPRAVPLPARGGRVPWRHVARSAAPAFRQQTGRAS